MASLFYLKITSPSGLVFGANVKSISSYNDLGKFDVLKDHTNFISIIKKQVEVIDESGEYKVFTLDNGIIRVISNIVDVYVGIGE